MNYYNKINKKILLQFILKLKKFVHTQIIKNLFFINFYYIIII